MTTPPTPVNPYEALFANLIDGGSIPLSKIVMLSFSYEGQDGFLGVRTISGSSMNVPGYDMTLAEFDPHMVGMELMLCSLLNSMHFNAVQFCKDNPELSEIAFGVPAEMAASGNIPFALTSKAILSHALKRSFEMLTRPQDPDDPSFHSVKFTPIPPSTE